MVNQNKKREIVLRIKRMNNDETAPIQYCKITMCSVSSTLARLPIRLGNTVIDGGDPRNLKELDSSE